MTTHKAQGVTVPEVFVLAGDRRANDQQETRPPAPRQHSSPPSQARSNQES
jgi:hypothetical protein